MGDWLGYGTTPRPVIPGSARAAIASALAAVDGQRVGTLSPEPLATALVFERRCLACRTFYGTTRMYMPFGGGYSAHLDVLCTRSHCKSLTCIYVSDAGVSANLSAYEGGPALRVNGNGYRR